jgi:hypothetical protein
LAIEPFSSAIFCSGYCTSIEHMEWSTKKKKLKRTNLYRKNSRYCNHLNNSPKHNLVYKEMIQELQVSFGTLCTHKNMHYKPKKYIASTQKKRLLSSWPMGVRRKWKLIKIYLFLFKIYFFIFEWF